jgi:hypothetical protein
MWHALFGTDVTSCRFWRDYRLLRLTLRANDVLAGRSPGGRYGPGGGRKQSPELFVLPHICPAFLTLRPSLLRTW